MAVMIAVGIFVTIALFLRHESIHGTIVLGTVLMAVSGRIIVVDSKVVGAPELYGLETAMGSTGLVY